MDVTPVWLMRQAGRYMPEYRKLKEKYAFLEMVKTPDIATEVTLQPVDAFNVDAAIFFRISCRSWSRWAWNWNTWGAKVP